MQRSIKTKSGYAFLFTCWPVFFYYNWIAKLQLGAIIWYLYCHVTVYSCSCLHLFPLFPCSSLLFNKKMKAIIIKQKWHLSILPSHFFSLFSLASLPFHCPPSRSFLPFSSSPFLFFPPWTLTAFLPLTNLHLHCPFSPLAFSPPPCL